MHFTSSSTRPFVLATHRRGRPRAACAFASPGDSPSLSDASCFRTHWAHPVENRALRRTPDTPCRATSTCCSTGTVPVVSHHLDGVSETPAPGLLHPIPDRIRIVAERLGRRLAALPKKSPVASQSPDGDCPAPSREEALRTRELAFPIRSHPTKKSTLRQPLHVTASHAPLPSVRGNRASRSSPSSPRPRLRGFHPSKRPSLGPKPCGWIPEALSFHGFLIPLQGAPNSTVTRRIAAEHPSHRLTEARRGMDCTGSRTPLVALRIAAPRHRIGSVYPAGSSPTPKCGPTFLGFVSSKSVD